MGEVDDAPLDLPDCSRTDDQCRADCLSGDAAACLSRAYALERDASNASQASGLYRRACLLGLANACTNYAATVWARDPTPSQSACTKRIFEGSCKANEPFACGMVERLALEEATSPEDFARSRQSLERKCAELGGFPCRVLAKHLESGELGPYEPGSIPSLLRQACEGGDPSACGEPATAAETFH